MKNLLKHPEFWVGSREIGSVAIGMSAWGLMMGVAMVKSGMSLIEVILMGTLVFAGSSQLASIPLIMAGAPMWVIFATSICVNLRFVVFSVHLRKYVMHQSFWRRMFSGYISSDLTYVQFVQRFPVPATTDEGRRAEEAYWLGNGATGWMAWTVSSMIGVALGNTIPQSWGLGFAGILALLGVTYAMLTSKLRLVAVVVSGAAAVASYALPLKLNVIVAIAVGVVMCLLLEKTPLGRTPAKQIRETKPVTHGEPT